LFSHFANIIFLRLFSFVTYILYVLNVAPYNNPISSLQIKENVAFVAWQFVLSG